MKLFTRSIWMLAASIALIVSALCPQSAFSLANCGTTSNLTVPAGPNGCDVMFGIPINFGNGRETSVAIIPSGLIVESNQTNLAGSSALYYRVGKRTGLSITWGNSQSLGVSGDWPQVVMTSDGYVISVHVDQTSRSGAHLDYRVGKLDPDGDQTQTISWVNDWQRYDGGYHPSLSINSSGVIAEVHESNSNSNRNTYFRIGHLNSDHQIVWDSGSGGIQYTSGVNPHVAINDNNDLVEVHQVPPPNLISQPELLLHYIRGKVQGGSIEWDKTVQPRYISNGGQPSVALTNSGFVTEVHIQDSLGYRMVGKLDPSDSKMVDWAGPESIVADPDNSGLRDYEYPAVNTDGSHVIFTDEENLILYSSVSDIRDRNNWMGDMLPSIGAKTLENIVIPGSHDAGMYCDSIAETQDQTLYGQLQGGQRYFDLRVLNSNPQRIYHGVSTATCDPVSTVMQDIRKFMMEGHKEVIVLKFSHFMDFPACTATNAYQTLRTTIHDNLSQWMYTGDTRPAQVTFNDMLADGGKVVVLIDGDWAAPQCNQVESGFWVYKDWCSGTSDCTSTGNPGQGQFNVFDEYSDTDAFDTMKSNQLEKFASYDGKMETDSTIPCNLFLLSWTLTSPVGGGVSEVSYDANLNLVSNMQTLEPNSGGFTPNILYVDYYERSRVTDTVIAMINRFSQLDTVQMVEPTFGPSGASGSDRAITVNRGASTGNSSTISVVGMYGFSGPVSLSCSIGPPAASGPATCSLSPASVTLTGSTAQTSTLTVNTTASKSAENQTRKMFWPSAGGTMLALVLIFIAPRDRRNWLAMSGLLILFAATGLSACGSGGGGNGVGRGSFRNPGTTAGTYTVTVTGTGTSTGSSNSVTATVGTVALTVN